MAARFRSPEPGHSLEELRALLRRELGHDVLSLRRVDLGSINAVYEASLANGLECFVKVAPPGQTAHLREEIWGFEQCRAVGVPAPEVLAFDPAPMSFPEPYHVTRRIPGENGLHAGLDRSGRLTVLRQLGHYLARMHAIRLEGFGLLRPSGQGFRGEYPTLWENLGSLLDAAPWWEELLRNGLVTGDQIDVVRRHFQEHRALFDSVSQACLVHADGGLKNLVVQGQCLVGVVDLENVVAAEAVNDFDALHFEGDEEFRAVCEGYDRQELFDAAFFRKLMLYRLLFSFAHLAYYSRRGDREAAAATQGRMRALAAELGSRL